MVKQSFSSEHDQNDPKVFKETLGTFGTTTKPGANQLQELQLKVRQGVKHVELHLGNQGKGDFGVQDVPDKYGFEQRRTIMQLAKLNKQSLSVHGTFSINSFSGFDGRGGFEDNSRLMAMKEIDETIKFAAETAKSGAVVFHIQGEQNISNDKGEINISKSYLNWLSEKAKTDDKYKKEFDNLKKNYFTANPLDREFVSDPNKIYDVKEEFRNLQNLDVEEYDKYMKKSNGNFNNAWKNYYRDKSILQKKLSPDMQPLIVVGDKLSSTDRKQDILNIDNLSDKSKFSNEELKTLNYMGIDLNHFDMESLQKTQSLFSNGFPVNLNGKINEDEYEKLKKKVIINYEDELKNNNYLQAQADESFHRKLLDFQINLANLQKKDLEEVYSLNEGNLKKIKSIQEEEKNLVSQINIAKKEKNYDKVKELNTKLSGGLLPSEEKEFEEIKNKLNSKKGSQSELQELFQRAQELEYKAERSGLQTQKQSLMGRIGQLEYQKLEKYDEMKAQINSQIKEFKSQKKDLRAVTDVSFDKNTTAMAHLGIKALQYQLNLKKKSETSVDELKKVNLRIKELTQEYDKASSNSEKDKISRELQKEKYKTKKLVGVKDYNDIDLVNNPLYLAPENMLPGYGTLTSLEEYKAVMRMSQEEFAKKILSNEPDYKHLKEEYEKETGVIIKTHDDAIKLAKRHLAGTFDNAHAAVWLKHFKRENNESDEHRLERFNSWLINQSELMAKEGLIKHVHFNDTQAKDDDHNLLGQGVLDLHEMKDRLRGAGIKEALIVEAGGRGAASNMHILNALEIFNPTLSYSNSSSSNVADWMSVNRNYNTRPQYSTYGMSYSSFRHTPPQQGREKGSWSGSGFF